MKRTIVKTIMFISSYCPLYVILLLSNIYGCWENRSVDNIALIFYSVIIVFILLSVVSVFMLKDAECGNTIKFEEIKRRGDLAVSYLVTYLIPIVGLKIEDVNTVIVNISFFMLIGFLYIKQNLMYMNPLWASFGFITYESPDCFIITDIPFSTLKRKQNMIIRGYYLTNDIFVAHKINNPEV